MPNLITRAAAIARHIHRGQYRKYTGRPYLEHCARVAALVSLQPNDVTDVSIAAAWLHDTVEDCRPEELETLIADIKSLDHSAAGQSVWDLVSALTNPSKQYPNIIRAAKKAMDREHLAKASVTVQVIKLCDRYDNLCELPHGDFRTQYGYESTRLVHVIGRASPVMVDAILDQIGGPPGQPRILLAPGLATS